MNSLKTGYARFHGEDPSWFDFITLTLLEKGFEGIERNPEHPFPQVHFNPRERELGQQAAVRGTRGHPFHLPFPVFL